jgi:hypothetical protein
VSMTLNAVVYTGASRVLAVRADGTVERK